MALVCLLGGGSLPAAHAQVIFADTFFHDVGPDPQWTSHFGDWQVTGAQQYNANSPSTNFATPALATVTGLSMPDFILDYDVFGATDGGAVFRFQDTNNTLALIVRPVVGDMYWHQRVGGDWGAILNPVPLGAPNGSDLHVNIVGTGNTFTATVTLFGTGTVVGTTTLNSALFASGGIGLYEWGFNGNQVYDNVVVSANNAAPEPGTFALLGLGLLTPGFALAKRRRNRR